MPPKRKPCTPPSAPAATATLIELTASAGLLGLDAEGEAWVPARPAVDWARAELPERCLLLFGQEGPGVTEQAQHAAVMTRSIAQFGSTRSINAGVAAGIAMHA